MFYPPDVFTVLYLHSPETERFTSTWGVKLARGSQKHLKAALLPPIHTHSFYQVDIKETHPQSKSISFQSNHRPQRHKPTAASVPYRHPPDLHITSRLSCDSIQSTSLLRKPISQQDTMASSLALFTTVCLLLAISGKCLCIKVQRAWLACLRCRRTCPSCPRGARGVRIGWRLTRPAPPPLPVRRQRTAPTSGLQAGSIQAPWRGRQRVCQQQQQRGQRGHRRV
jgi:hypothetical protein